MGSTKIKLDSDLINRAKEFAESEGYSDVEEFITHAIEQAISGAGEEEDEAAVREKLQGLGYIS